MCVDALLMHVINTNKANKILSKNRREGDRLYKERAACQMISPSSAKL